MAGHRSIKRIVHRCMEELDATRKIAKVTSLKEALETFRAKIDIQIMNHNGYYENEARKKHLLKKHDIMIRYYEKTFGDFLETYDYNHGNQELPKSEYADCIWICWWQGLDQAPELVKICVNSIRKNAGGHKVIILTEDNYKDYVDMPSWVCWWQGLDQAPELVKICVNSIRKNAGGHKVIILTEDNYKDYVDMPSWVEEKREKGIISRTHYSDILRLMLLAKYGGVWLDSTFFCTNDQIKKYFEYPLWSIKRPDYFHASVAAGYFANYSLGCDEGQIIFMHL